MRPYCTELYSYIQMTQPRRPLQNNPTSVTIQSRSSRYGPPHNKDTKSFEYPSIEYNKKKVNGRTFQSPNQLLTPSNPKIVTILLGTVRTRLTPNPPYNPRPPSSRKTVLKACHRPLYFEPGEDIPPC